MVSPAALESSLVSGKKDKKEIKEKYFHQQKNHSPVVANKLGCSLEQPSFGHTTSPHNWEQQNYTETSAGLCSH